MQVEGITKNKDLIFTVLDNRIINSAAQIPIIVFYKKPLDYPEHYIARLFDKDRPTNMILRKDNLEELRKSIPHHMVRINVSECDDEKIIESYI